MRICTVVTWVHVNIEYQFCEIFEITFKYVLSTMHTILIFSSPSSITGVYVVCSIYVSLYCDLNTPLSIEFNKKSNVTSTHAVGKSDLKNWLNNALWLFIFVMLVSMLSSTTHMMSLPSLHALVHLSSIPWSLTPKICIQESLFLSYNDW